MTLKKLRNLVHFDTHIITVHVPCRYAAGRHVTDDGMLTSWEVHDTVDHFHAFMCCLLIIITMHVYAEG